MFRRLFLLFMIVGLFLSCSKDKSSNQIEGGTVVIGVLNDFDALNEFVTVDSKTIRVIEHLLFLPLTSYDSTFTIIPRLAESWEFSLNRDTLTYFLRKDVTWSDGQPTTAHDVVFTCKSAMDPTTGYPNASRFDYVKDIRLLDDYTDQFIFTEPYADPLEDTQIPIMPRHILELVSPDEIKTCNFNRHPIGNGPFKLERWKAGQEVIFTANEIYYLGRPKLDRIIFRIIPDKVTQMTNLLAGKIDIMTKIKARQDLTLYSYPRPGFTFIGWNLKHPLFNTKIVRQALTYGIDRQEIVDAIFYGQAQILAGPLSPVSWAFNSKIQSFSYDLDIAQNLLQQAGWNDTNNDGILDRNGSDFRFQLLVNVGNQIREDISVIVQAQLRKLGIIVDIQKSEWSVFIQRLKNKEFDAIISRWDEPVIVDPTDIWHTRSIKKGYNFISFSHRRVDSLIELGRRTPDRSMAKQYWNEFQGIIADECPYTFLYTQNILNVINSRLRHVQMDSRSYLINVSEWQISDHP